MEYCPISLLFSLPAVASDSTLTTAANWATIFGLFGIFFAWRAYREQQNALKLQKQSLDKQIKDSKTADENTKIALAKQDEMIEQQKILGAWSLLAQKGTGDLGRKDALEFLHKQGKSLAGLDLSNAYLVGLKLKKDTEKKIPRADLCRAIFNKADLWKAHFEGADLARAHFEGADLQGAHFTGADLGNVHFKGAILGGANFDNAYLCGAIFDGVTVYSSIKFRKANLTHTNFSNFIDLTFANFVKLSDLFDRITFNDCYVEFQLEECLPTAPEGYEFVFETNKDGKQQTEVVDGVERYYIKLIKTETKNP